MANAQLRGSYLARRAERNALEGILMGELATVQGLERALAAAGGSAADPNLAQLLEDARARAAAAASQTETASVEAEALRAAALNGNEFVLLDNALPVLLLPVRLEVRAGRPSGTGWDFDTAATATHLVVRIFPDQCHLDAHDPLITDEEAVWAREYADRLAGLKDVRERLPAWSELVRRAGPQRARWLAALGGKDPGRRPGPWGREARARLLPDRWHVRVTFGDGATTSAASSTLTREPLPAGPGPRSGDASVAWARSLPDAFQAGMAVAVDLGGRPPSSVRRVTCAGVRAALTPEAAREELGSLLTAHRCTDGLAVLAPASPTTSTERGRAPRRDFAPASMADVFRESRGALDAQAAGTRIAGALGLDAAVLLHVDGADGVDLHVEDRLRHLLTDTVQAGLTDLLCPPLPVWAVAAAADHLRAWVSALGPLPTLRTGAQPYGVLPLRRVLHARPDASVLTEPVAVVAERFRQELWSPAVERSPRIRPGLNQPEQTLVELLRRDGAPAAWTVRLLAPDPLSAELLAQGPAWQDRRDAARSRLAALLDVPAEPTRALGLALASEAAALTVPLVASDSEHPSQYLTTLLNLPLRDLPDPRHAGPRPLLYHLARAALLEAADASVRRAADAQGEPPEFFPRWSSGVSSATDEGFWTVWDRLGYGIGNQVAADWLDANLTDPGAAEYAQARQLVAELAWYSAPTSASIPPVDLEPILRATLSLGHRLDTWYTSLATQRLQGLRDEKGRGLTIGAYGVLDGFLPGGLAAPTGGYIHAPGLTHAATAAVLRSAHLARSGGQAATAASRTAAVNLSSHRVRAALALLDGIRAGQPLSELLGQRLEETLARANQQVLIAPLRARFPLVAGRLVPTAGNEDREAAAAPVTVDGQAALGAAGFPGNPAIDGGFLPAYRPLTDAEVTDLRTALDALADNLDAMGDVLLAEGVYQLAQGNMARAAATMDFLAGAPVGVPDPEVARTPRTARARELRLAVVIRDDAVADPAWPTTPRAAAEPRLAAWAAGVLPPPAEITIAADRGGPQGPGRDMRATLAELNATAAARSHRDLMVGPLDLALPPSGVSPDGDDPLSARLVALLALAFSVDRSTLTIHPAEAIQDGFSIQAAVESARHVGELALAARPLAPSDLQATGETTEPLTVEPSTLFTRAAAARAALDDLSQRLNIWLAAPHDREQLVDLLAAADHFGVPGALPADWDEVPGAQRARAAAVQREAARRVSATPATPATADDAAAAVRTLFGGRHLVLPRLRARDAAWTARIRAQTATSSSTETTTELVRWAAVRAPAGRLHLVDLVARACGGDAGTVDTVALPALAPGSGTATLLAYQPLDGAWDSDDICGLALDRWVDTTPADEETTGIAFHADAPTSEPPNVWLIGVPEANNDDWSAGDLFAYIDEALDLARLRAVSPTDLGLDHLVPPWLLYVEPRAPGPHWGTADPDNLTRPPS